MTKITDQVSWQIYEIKSMAVLEGFVQCIEIYMQIHTTHYITDKLKGSFFWDSLAASYYTLQETSRKKYKSKYYGPCWKSPKNNTTT